MTFESFCFAINDFRRPFSESTCCSGGKQPKAPKEKKPKKEKPKKSDASDKAEGKAEGKQEAGKRGSGKDKEKGGKPSPYQVKEFTTKETFLALLCKEKQKLFLFTLRIFLDIDFPLESIAI